MKPSRTVCILILLLAVTSIIWKCVDAPVYAHPSPFSYLDIRIDPDELGITLTAHTLDFAHDLHIEDADALLSSLYLDLKSAAVFDLIRPRFTLALDGRAVELEPVRIDPLPDRQALSLHYRVATETLAGEIGIHCALFPYDPLHQTFLNIYEEDELRHQEIFDKDRTKYDYFTGGRQGRLAVVNKFIRAGIHHIFIGPDHILFIVGLLLLGGSMLRLLTIVTAFTIAHSITLTLAALNFLSPPASLIEPVIALSIVYVGVDNMMWREGNRDVRAWIAFFFGFVHGFGFAGVLQEFGLPQSALGWSLFSFNLGVEIGQVCIVIPVAAMLTVVKGRNENVWRRVVWAGSTAVILAGIYWFIERVFF